MWAAWVRRQIPWLDVALIPLSRVLGHQARPISAARVGVAASAC
jgi:hypothetical protein